MQPPPDGPRPSWSPWSLPAPSRGGGDGLWALACGCAAALIRVETWPFLLVARAFLWRRRPEDRPLLVGAILAVPAAWIVPELVGSGELLRSASRARVPNPGQPGLSDFPALTSLRAALTLALWPLWVGLALASWRAGLPVATSRRPGQGGGRRGWHRCDPRLRAALLAQHLGVPRHRVEPDEAPEAPGVVFRSALHAGEAPAPDIPVGFRPVAQVGLWQVLADCRSDDRAAPSDDAAFWSSPWPMDTGVTTKPG
jgi:hypothetical protein